MNSIGTVNYYLCRPLITEVNKPKSSTVRPLLAASSRSKLLSAAVNQLSYGRRTKGFSISASSERMTTRKARQIEGNEPINGNHITILSVDGGGVRGMIPAVILGKLEQLLQEIEGGKKTARIADYFDVIAGTSNGGLITSLLVTPDFNDKDKSRPRLAESITKFYYKNCPEIFKTGFWSWVGQWTSGPLYDGNKLREIIRKETQRIKLDQTFTNVVIPTFDIKKLQPVIFSTFQVPINSAINASLADICIGTSAAPTYFPPHYFDDFNLIDGGMAANDPTLAAITEVSKQIKLKNPAFPKMEKVEFERFLVLSLGTGVSGGKNADGKEKYNAREASKWGAMGWVIGDHPLVECFQEGSSDMVAYHNSIFFQSIDQGDNYIRINEYELKGNTAKIDDASTKNLADLEEVGKKLLRQPQKRYNVKSGLHEEFYPKITNEAALRDFAVKLVRERNARKETFKRLRSTSSTATAN